MADQTPDTVVTPTQTDPQQPEDMGMFVGKFVVGFLGGPVGSKLLSKIGITLDPMATSVFIAMALHKLHGIAKEQWPDAKWL